MAPKPNIGSWQGIPGESDNPNIGAVQGFESAVSPGEMSCNINISMEINAILSTGLSDSKFPFIKSVGFEVGKNIGMF